MGARPPRVAERARHSDSPDRRLALPARGSHRPPSRQPPKFRNRAFAALKGTMPIVNDSESWQLVGMASSTFFKTWPHSGETSARVIPLLQGGVPLEKLQRSPSLVRWHRSIRSQRLAVKACEHRTNNSPPVSFSSLPWRNRLPGCHSYPRYSRAILRSDRRGG